MNMIQALVHKHRKLLTYVLCSLATAVLETVAGWCLIRLFAVSIIYANTAGILVGAAAHYLLTLAFVFGLRHNVQSALAYIATFVMGLLLQNAIIWLCYEVFFGGAGLFWQYLISKGLSLVIPFFLNYYLRTVINQAIKKKRGESA